MFSSVQGSGKSGQPTVIILFVIHASDSLKKTCEKKETQIICVHLLSCLSWTCNCSFSFDLVRTYYRYFRHNKKEFGILIWCNWIMNYDLWITNYENWLIRNKHFYHILHSTYLYLLYAIYICILCAIYISIYILVFFFHSYATLSLDFPQLHLLPSVICNILTTLVLAS